MAEARAAHGDVARALPQARFGPRAFIAHRFEEKPIRLPFGIRRYGRRRSREIQWRDADQLGSYIEETEVTSMIPSARAVYIPQVPPTRAVIVCA